MWSSCKRSSGTQLGQWYKAGHTQIRHCLTSLKLEQLTTLWKHLSQIPTDINAVSCGPRAWKISWIADAIFSARHPQKSSQHVGACAAGDGAICSKNRKIVPYHGANPSTKNGARLRSPSPIMAPGSISETRSTISKTIYLRGVFIRPPAKFWQSFASPVLAKSRFFSAEPNFSFLIRGDSMMPPRVLSVWAKTLQEQK